MFRRHAITRWLLSALLAFAIVACGNQAAPAATPSPAASSSNTRVTLVLWHGWSDTKQQALSRLIDSYNQQHPEGRVLAQTMPLVSLSDDVRAATAAGTGPHLVLIPSTWVGSLAAEGAFLPLDDLIAPAEQSTLLPATLGGARARGSDAEQHLYGLPISFDTVALFYNKANVLEPPADTEIMFRQARGLSDPEATPPVWGLAFSPMLENMIGYLYAFGGDVFDDDGNVVLGEEGRPGAERWLSWMRDLSSDPQLLVRPDSSIQVDRELKNGYVLMTIAWAHHLEQYRRLWGENLGVAPLPQLSDTGRPPVPYVQSDILAINSRVDEHERRAAVAFLRFMISEEAQGFLLDNDIQPASMALDLSADTPQAQAARAFRIQAERGQPMPNGPQRRIIRDELQLMQQQVLTGRLSPSEAVTEADSRLRALLVP